MVIYAYTVYMNSYNKSLNHSSTPTPPLVSKRLLDQVRERLRYMHYSLQTEKSYVYWIKFFILWHGRMGPMRHPREMGGTEVEALRVKDVDFDRHAIIVRRPRAVKTAW
jgi:Phage integrase, N-terminal SAM-like domain